MRELAKGKVGREKNKWLGWREFVEWLRDTKKQDASTLEGVFVVTHVFPPNRFPTATLVFYVDELDNGVKKAISPREWSMLAELFPAGRPVKGMTLFLSFSNGEYSILADDTPTAVYAPTPAGGWELV